MRIGDRVRCLVSGVNSDGVQLGRNLVMGFGVRGEEYVVTQITEHHNIRILTSLDGLRHGRANVSRFEVLGRHEEMLNAAPVVAPVVAGVERVTTYQVLWRSGNGVPMSQNSYLSEGAAQRRVRTLQNYGYQILARKKYTVDIEVQDNA